LAKDGVVPQQQFDSAKAAWQAATADVANAQAAIKQQQAVVQQKSAAVNVAQANLNYSTIRSPIDGTVVARNVDVGQTVAASLQAPTLFTIAQDLTKMQVYVSTDESDVGAIKIGQQATFKVDAFPNETFTGKVAQVRLNATTVQNVVTYTTVVDFDNPQMKLFPGMTAYVSIPVAQAQDVLKVPNGALRFKPQTANAAQGQKSGSGKQASTTMGTVWKLAADKKSLQPVQIKLGITDHTFTQVAQVMNGSLNPGDQVVVGSAAATQQRTGTGAPGVGGAARGFGR
jgi:HlyD family secretion protein